MTRGGIMKDGKRQIKYQKLSKQNKPKNEVCLKVQKSENSVQNYELFI